MDIAIVNSSITRIDADLLVMRHANGFYGTDSIVAEPLRFPHAKMRQSGEGALVVGYRWSCPSAGRCGQRSTPECLVLRVPNFAADPVSVRRLFHMFLSRRWPINTASMAAGYFAELFLVSGCWPQNEGSTCAAALKAVS
jgi:hypothetical protein